MSKTDRLKELNQLHNEISTRLKATRRRRDKLLYEANMLGREIQELERKAYWCCQKALKLGKEITHEEN